MSERIHAVEHLKLLTEQLETLEMRLQRYFSAAVDYKKIHVEIELENQRVDGTLHQKRERVTVKADDRDYAQFGAYILQWARAALLAQRDAKQVEINTQLQLVAQLCEKAEEAEVV